MNPWSEPNTAVQQKQMGTLAESRKDRDSLFVFYIVYIYTHLTEVFILRCLMCYS